MYGTRVIGLISKKYPEGFTSFFRHLARSQGWVSLHTQPVTDNWAPKEDKQDYQSGNPDLPVFPLPQLITEHKNIKFS